MLWTAAMSTLDTNQSIAERDMRGNALRLQKIGKISLQIGLLLLAVMFLYETWLVVAMHSQADLQAGSPDESLMIDCLPKHGLLFGFLAAYGPFFWGILSALNAIIPATYQIFVLRIIFVLFKYIAWLILLRELCRGQNFWRASVFLLALMTTPGYLFFGKIIAPEYLLFLPTSLCFAFLLQDRARFGSHYLWALVCAALTTATKISAAPITFCVVAYGLLYPLFIPDARSRYRSIIRNTLLVLILLALATLSLVNIHDSVDQIRAVAAIIPEARYNVDALTLAWNRTEMTWDRILVGGLSDDFLPLIIVTMILPLALIVRKMLAKDNGAILLAIVLSGVLMLISAISHGLAFSWYVFIPMYLLAFAALMSLPSQQMDRLYIGLYVVLLVVFAVQGAHRMHERISLKINNNHQLARHALTMQKVVQYFSNEVPCARTGNLDLLVPQIPSSSAIVFTPARLSLNPKTPPDVLVVNRQLDEHMMLQFALKGDLSQYREIQQIGPLSLYARTNLSCLKQLS